MRAEFFHLKLRTVIPVCWHVMPAIAWLKRIPDETADSVYRYNRYEVSNHD